MLERRAVCGIERRLMPERDHGGRPALQIRRAEVVLVRHRRDDRAHDVLRLDELPRRRRLLHPAVPHAAAPALRRRGTRVRRECLHGGSLWDEGPRDRLDGDPPAAEIDRADDGNAGATVSRLRRLLQGVTGRFGRTSQLHDERGLRRHDEPPLRDGLPLQLRSQPRPAVSTRSAVRRAYTAVR